MFADTPVIIKERLFTEHQAHQWCAACVSLSHFRKTNQKHGNTLRDLPGYTITKVLQRPFQVFRRFCTNGSTQKDSDSLPVGFPELPLLRQLFQLIAEKLFGVLLMALSQASSLLRTFLYETSHHPLHSRQLQLYRRPHPQKKFWLRSKPNWQISAIVLLFKQ